MMMRQSKGKELSPLPGAVYTCEDVVPTKWGWVVEVCMKVSLGILSICLKLGWWLSKYRR